MSMTFNQAARKYKSGELSWNDYIDLLLARLAGDGHEDDDEEPAGCGLLEEVDPLAAYIYDWSEVMEFWIEPSTVKPVFTAYRSDALRDEIKTALNGIKKPADQRWARMCLAQLALEDRKAETLKWLLDEGGVWNSRGFELEANCVDETTDPETFKVIEESEFRKRWPRRPPTPAEERDPDAEYDESKTIPGDGREFDLDYFIEHELDSSHPLY